MHTSNSLQARGLPAAMEMAAMRAVEAVAAVFERGGVTTRAAPIAAAPRSQRVRILQEVSPAGARA
eukprot:3712821-Pleurochrysis_carterae.AAC.2